MINRFVFRVNTPSPLPADRAYLFYSYLLSLLQGDYTEELHEPKETPISQCLYSDSKETLWQIHLLDQESNDADVLYNLKGLSLNSGEVDLELVKHNSYSVEELIETAKSIDSKRFFSLRFFSPTAFKQSGKYTVLPEKELIIKSLLRKWNTSFPTYPLEDDDAFRMLAEGIRISDYYLHTTRFMLKNNRIPGFIGTISFDTHLSVPLLDIWKILIAFSEFSGVGIKTALGMGGVKLFVPRDKRGAVM